MTTGETLIALLLIIIAYFLYHIAKQLSYLTGKRLKISFFKWHSSTYFSSKLPTSSRKEKDEKLPN